jgi:hypothetical protein
MRSTSSLRALDCVADRIRAGVPDTTESQRVRDQIEAVFILARSNLVNVLSRGHLAPDFPHRVSSDGFEKIT